jgi:hypothetical protein
MVRCEVGRVCFWWTALPERWRPPQAITGQWGLFLGIGLALKHGEFGLLGESRLFHNGTSMYAV